MPELTWDDNAIDASGVDAVSAQLWNRYGDTISIGEYSKGGDWHRFSQVETEKIAKAREPNNPESATVT